MYTTDEYIKCLEGLSKKSSNDAVMTTTINTTNPDEKTTVNKSLITEYLFKMGSNTNIKKTKSQEFSNMNSFLNMSNTSTKKVNNPNLPSMKSPRLVYQKHRQDSFTSGCNFQSTIIKKKAFSPQPHLRRTLYSPIRKEHTCPNCELLSMRIKRLEKTVKDLNFKIQHSKSIAHNSFKANNPRIEELVQENSKLKRFKEKVIEMSKTCDIINSNLNSFVEEVRSKISHADQDDRLELVSNQYENIYKELNKAIEIKHQEYLIMVKHQEDEISILKQKLKGVSQKDMKSGRIFR